jgi:hypothetical protein
MLIQAGNPISPGAVTTVEVPDDMGLGDQFLNTVGALSLHLPEGVNPLWVETDDEQLQRSLRSHYALSIGTL